MSTFVGQTLWNLLDLKYLTFGNVGLGRLESKNRAERKIRPYLLTLVLICIRSALRELLSG